MAPYRGVEFPFFSTSYIQNLHMQYSQPVCHGSFGAGIGTLNFDWKAFMGRASIIHEE
jgi:L-aminopeptidase/D-esterase-like protein